MQKEHLFIQSFCTENEINLKQVCFQHTTTWLHTSQTDCLLSDALDRTIVCYKSRKSTCNFLTGPY